MIKKFLKGTLILRLYYLFYPQRPLYRDSLWQTIMLSRWVLYVRLYARAFFLLLIRGFKVRKVSASGHLFEVIRHNCLDDFGLAFARRRSEHLIYLMRSVPSLKKDASILSIGPRNEGEILLLNAHGYKNVEAIDLFSYSPRIGVRDMHKTGYPANIFDAIISGWVLRYSQDVPQTLREMIRISRNNALFAIGFSAGPQDAATPYLGTSLAGGTSEILSILGENVKQVYWRLDDENENEKDVPEHTHSLLARIKK